MNFFQKRKLRRIYGSIIENKVYRKRTFGELNKFTKCKWRSSRILKKAPGEKINGNRPKVCHRLRLVDRINGDLNKFTQRVIIADKIDRDRWNIVKRGIKSPSTAVIDQEDEKEKYLWKNSKLL